jgi:hypothetical protein
VVRGSAWRGDLDIARVNADSGILVTGHHDHDIRARKAAR